MIYYVLALLFFIFTTPPLCFISQITGFTRLNPIPLFTPGVAIACPRDDWNGRDYRLPTNPITEIAVLGDGFHMRITDSILSSKQSGRVVIAGLQPKTDQMVRRSAMGFSRPRTAYTHKTVSISIPQRRVYVGAFYQNNNVYLAAVQVNSTVEVTKEYLIHNPAVPNVQKKFGEFVDLVGSDKRLAPLNKVLNLEEWRDTKDKPILVFNLDSTHGVYKKNSKVATCVRGVLKLFLEQNKDLKFEIRYRASEAEHPNQKSQLDSLLMQQKDASTYLLDKEAYLSKTKNIDLEMPSDIKLVTEWFDYNGEQTIAYLLELWNTGQLKNSVESFDKFETAIRACVQADITAFRQTGLANTDIEFPGQIRGMTIGKYDCRAFAAMLYHTPLDSTDRTKVSFHARSFMEKSKDRAAYIHNGMHLFPVGSPAHRSQQYESSEFLSSFKTLVDTLHQDYPSVMKDPQIQSNLNDFYAILNGKGSYADIVTGKTFKKFLKDLRNPKAHASMFSRVADVRK